MRNSPFADPRFQQAFRNLEQAVGYQNQGLFDQAEKTYARVVKKFPDYFDALHFYGVFKFQRGSLNEALKLLSRATKINPRSANALSSLGVILAELGRHADALARFDAALQLDPNNVRALGNRCNALNELGRYDEAIKSSERALAIEPNYSEACIPRGAALMKCRRYAEALDSYERAIRLNPHLAIAWVGRGNIFSELKRYDLALAAHDKAIALKPDLPEAWAGRGTVLYGMAHYIEALDAYDKALALKRDDAEAWLGRGNALLETNRVTEAFAALDRALAIKPDLTEAISSRIFALDYTKDAGFEQQQEARHYWWQHVGAAIAAKSRIEHRNARDPERRIKLGYVSSDLREHSAAFCFRPMLLNHDKSRFEITCYSCSLVEDEVTKDFQRAADRWRGVAQLSDDELCAQIQADEIDILVDLSGYTAGHRLNVFARKPAPLQVSAGATGTGLPTVDYLFSDPVVCPQAVRHLFAEKIFDLPSIMTIEALPAQLRPSDPPVLSKGHITFGVFNRASKISDDVVALWARILQAVPAAQLLMKHYAFDEAAMRSRQLERFAAHGIAADRIAFLGATARDAHLAALREVDISLDPFPQNGGISALESLQMGVPVVALLGNSISSRAAGAILSCAGLGDWVADTAEEYLAIAVKFAAMPDHLKSLRYELPARIAASAVGNSAIYTKAVETAYRTMWQDYCRATIGQPLTA